MQLGWQEVFLVMLFALLVFGPKRLPEIGRQIGRAVREVRRVSGDFEREIRSYTGDLGAEAREFERTVKTNFGLDEDHSRFLTSEPKRRAASSPDGSSSRREGIPAPDRPQPAPKAPPETPAPPPSAGIPAPERPQPAPGVSPDAPRS